MPWISSSFIICLVDRKYCFFSIPSCKGLIYIYHICSNIIYTVKLILNFCTIEIIWSNFTNFLFPSPPWGTGRLNLKKLIISVQILQKFEKMTALISFRPLRELRASKKMHKYKDAISIFLKPSNWRWGSWQRKN